MVRTRRPWYFQRSTHFPIAVMARMVSMDDWQRRWPHTRSAQRAEMTRTALSVLLCRIVASSESNLLCQASLLRYNALMLNKSLPVCPKRFNGSRLPKSMLFFSCVVELLFFFKQREVHDAEVGINALRARQLPYQSLSAKDMFPDSMDRARNAGSCLYQTFRPCAFSCIAEAKSPLTSPGKAHSPR